MNKQVDQKVPKNLNFSIVVPHDVYRVGQAKKFAQSSIKFEKFTYATPVLMWKNDLNYEKITCEN